MSYSSPTGKKPLANVKRPPKLSPIYAVQQQEIEDSEGIFSKELSPPSPLAQQKSTPRNPTSERKLMFENEPLTFAGFSDASLSVSALLSFSNNKNHKGNINVAEANIKLGRQYLKRWTRSSSSGKKQEEEKIKSKIEEKLLHVDAKIDAMGLKISRAECNLNKDLEQYNTNFCNIRERLKEIRSLNGEYERTKEEIEHLKRTSEDVEEQASNNTFQLLTELREKAYAIEQKVLQYKQKVKEVQDMKQSLGKLNEAITQKDHDITRAQQKLKEARKKIVITSDSESIAKQFKALTTKNQELQKGLDFYTKHKDSLMKTYESLAYKNKILEEAGLKFILALKVYKKKTMHFSSTDDTCGKTDSSSDALVLQQAVEQFETLLKGEHKH